jgi:predicted double-glycine peptidase
VLRVISVAVIATGVILLPLAGIGGNLAPVQSMAELRHSKLIMQQYDLSCGAAALATLLRYQHGEAVTEKDVAIGLVSRDEYLRNPDILRIRQGFSVLDMNRYVERLGYAGEALGQLDFEDLSNMAPAIVPVRIHGYNHFVVFRGAIGSSVLLGDPAFGNRTLTKARFLAVWTDYADLGRVAFAVHRRDGLIPPNRLAPTAADFPLLD